MQRTQEASQARLHAITEMHIQQALCMLLANYPYIYIRLYTHLSIGLYVPIKILSAYIICIPFDRLYGSYGKPCHPTLY